MWDSACGHLSSVVASVWQLRLSRHAARHSFSTPVASITVVSAQSVQQQPDTFIAVRISAVQQMPHTSPVPISTTRRQLGATRRCPFTGAGTGPRPL
eukprot:5156536-Alexandrium_andersonii.AAC.1